MKLLEIKTLVELVNMNTNDEGVVMRDDAKIAVTKDKYDTIFEVETRSCFYSKCVSVPNNLIEMLVKDMLNYSVTSTRTSTILYYMAGYSPRMTLKELTTIDIVIGGLIYG